MENYLSLSDKDLTSDASEKMNKSDLDLFQRHPVFYFFLWVFLFLGIAAFLIVILNAVRVIDVLNDFSDFLEVFDLYF